MKKKISSLLVIFGLEIIKLLKEGRKKKLIIERRRPRLFDLLI